MPPLQKFLSTESFLSNSGSRETPDLNQTKTWKKSRQRAGKKAGWRAGFHSPAAEAGSWDGSQVGQEGQVLGLIGKADTSAVQIDTGDTGPHPVGRILRRVGVKAAVTSGRPAGPQQPLPAAKKLEWGECLHPCLLHPHFPVHPQCNRSCARWGSTVSGTGDVVSRPT